MIKPGDTVQAYIELSGDVVAAVRLEYTQDGGQRWTTEKTQAGASMSYTGTVASPLTSGTVCQEFVENETPKPKVYRWRCTSYTSGTLPCYMNKHEVGLKRFSFGDDLFLVWDDEAPLSGIDGDGAGFAGHGSLYCDTSDDGIIYRNQGSKTSVNWTSI